MQLDLSTPYCGQKNYLRLEYDRVTDKIVFMPCCFIKPLDNNMIEPIAWPSDYFINNIEKCIYEYTKYDLKDLNKLFKGTCCAVYPTSKKLCTNYKFNKSLSRIDTIDFGISSFCNFKCVMCVHDKSYNQKEEYLYLKLLDYFKNRKDIKTSILSNKGEPFIYKEATFDYLENSNSNVEIITNAMLLTQSDIIKLSKYRSKLKITVSCDGITKETYEKIRVNGNFEKVINNIKLLNNFGLLYKVNYVLQDYNIHEQLDIKKFFENLGVTLNIYFDERSNIKSKIDESILTNYRLEFKDILKYKNK